MSRSHVPNGAFAAFPPFAFPPASAPSFPTMTWLISTVEKKHQSPSRACCGVHSVAELARLADQAGIAGADASEFRRPKEPGSRGLIKLPPSSVQVSEQAISVTFHFVT